MAFIDAAHVLLHRRHKRVGAERRFFYFPTFTPKTSGAGIQCGGGGGFRWAPTMEYFLMIPVASPW